METLDLIEVAPALAAAIVAAQLAADAVPKRGHNKQLGKKYATADDIAAAAKKALNANGAAFVRVGVDLDAGKLEDFDLGNQGYAGDSVETWMLIHESGAALVGTQRVPIVVSKGRPHEKALSATLTYADGFALRGILCLEREEPGNNVDGRDDAPGQDQIQRRPSRPPTLREQVISQVDRVARELRMNKGAAWSECLAAAELPSDLGGDKGPGSDAVTDTHLAALLRASHAVIKAGVSDPKGAP